MRSRGFDLVGFLPNYPYSPRPSRESGRGRALCTLRVRRLDREPNIGKKWGPADPEQPEPARPRDRREIDFGADTLWRDPSSPERGTCDHRTRRTNDGRLPSGRGSRPSRNRRRGAGTGSRKRRLRENRDAFTPGSKAQFRNLSACATDGPGRDRPILPCPCLIPPRT